jgi:hypothetical protein
VRFSIIIILILFLYFDTFNLVTMELPHPKVLFLVTRLSNVHSFVKRLHRDLCSNFDVRAALSFNIQRAFVKLHGIGGRTVDKLTKFVHFGLSL